mmetsp:Transcript_11188/g.31934  ORF Transcript_11188/g.31934 Transcript_11188/m.31934 type:complete len:219 (+) Transcript_11188:1119-1775(+)
MEAVSCVARWAKRAASSRSASLRMTPRWSTTSRVSSWTGPRKASQLCKVRRCNNAASSQRPLRYSSMAMLSCAFSVHGCAVPSANSDSAKAILESSVASSNIASSRNEVDKTLAHAAVSGWPSPKSRRLAPRTSRASRSASRWSPAACSTSARRRAVSRADGRDKSCAATLPCRRNSAAASLTFPCAVSNSVARTRARSFSACCASSRASRTPNARRQ